MPVKVILSSTLRRYVQDYDPTKGMEVPVPKGTSLGQLIKMLGIPEKEIKIAMVNGVKVSLDTELEGEERIGLFPAVGGG